MRSPFESSISPKEDSSCAALRAAMQSSEPLRFAFFNACEESVSSRVLDQGQSSWQKEDVGPLGRCDFQLGTRLGSGSQGSIHEALDNQGEMTSKVAKKVYFKKDENRAAIEREIFLHKLLTEKASSSYETGIIELLGYEQDSNGITLLMPKCKLALVKIMPLLQEMVAIQEHKVQVEFLLFDLFASLVRALNTLAKNHVIHCDIKPENIMLSPDGVDDSVDWCLIDLGCASKPHSPHDAGKTFCGTAPYFSPEAILRSENFYPRDIWAVGYLLNEIMNPSQCESASLYDCREARKKVLDEEEQKMQAPLFSEKDIPSELRFNSENERRDFFRYIQRSLVGQQFLQLVEAAKKGQSNFRVCFMYLINAMLNPIAESRPTAADLARLLPALETLLPSSRPEGYGKTILLEYFEMWSLAKEEKEKSGIYSLNSSGMFCASAGRHSPGDPPSLLGQTLRPLTANNEETKQALLSDSRLSF